MIWVVGVARAGFVDVTPAELSLGGNKATGAAVFDYDQDGDWDLVAPTADGERLLESDGAGGWRDRTDELAPGLLTSSATRGLLAADLDHDGDPDLVRIERYLLTVFENQGPPDHRLAPVWQRQADPGGQGFEGSALMDDDRDGWLDVLLGEGSLANWIFYNPGDGSLILSPIDQVPLGMTLSWNSDFATAGDWDQDGDIDVVLRGGGQGADAFVREPSGWRPVSGFDLDAVDAEKGTVSLCDVQGVGALDLIWTSTVEPAVRVFRWAPLLETWAPIWESSSSPVGNHGVDCGDLDNDGVSDLWLADDDGDDLLLGPDLESEEDLDGVFDTIAVTLADLDQDLDLDVYQLHRDSTNVLLRNDSDTSSVLQLSILANTAACPDAPVLRDDLGGQARAYDLDGQPLGSRLELSGGMGRGQTAWPVLQFGNVSPDAPVRIEVDFFYGGEGPFLVEIPAGVRRFSLIHDDPDGDGIPTGIEREGLDPYRDLDGDGLFDWADADADGDGIGDREEQGGADRCGPLADADRDGLPDIYDTRIDPSAPSTTETVGTPAGTLDPDSDGDGVPDSADSEPLDAGGRQGDPPVRPVLGCRTVGGGGGWLLLALLGIRIGRRDRPGGPRSGSGPPSDPSSCG